MEVDVTSVGSAIAAALLYVVVYFTSMSLVINIFSDLTPKRVPPL